MPEHNFRHVARKMGALNHPIVERSPKAVWNHRALASMAQKTSPSISDVSFMHALHRCAQGHVGYLASAWGGADKRVTVQTQHILDGDLINQQLPENEHGE